MSSRQYATNLSVPPFLKSPPPSLALTSPSMYSQPSLPRDSWNSIMFPPHDNTEHKSVHPQSSSQRSRASSIELSESSSDRRNITAGYHTQTTHKRGQEQSHASPRHARVGQLSNRSNNSISAPKRLSRSYSATGPRRRSDLPLHHERSSQKLTVTQQEEPRLMSVCSTVGSVIGYYSNSNSGPASHASSTDTVRGSAQHLHTRRREAPIVIWKPLPQSEHLISNEYQTYRTGPRIRGIGANPPQSPSVCSTTTYVESDVTAVLPSSRSGVPYPTAAPDSLKSKIRLQSGTLPQDNRAIRTVQYSPYDIVIDSATAPNFEMDDVPRWRRKEARGQGFINRFFNGRRRASSLNSHRRRLGVNAMTEPSSFHYKSSMSASVRSLPARMHSAVSLTTFAGNSSLKRGKSLKSRFLSFFSTSTATVETQSQESAPTSANTRMFSRSVHSIETPTSSSFSLSKFSLLTRRERSNSTEEIRSYIEKNHPSIKAKAAGNSRPVSPRRAESLTGWVSSDFHLDPMEARMTARSLAISDGTRRIPYDY